MEAPFLFTPSEQACQGCGVSPKKSARRRAGRFLHRSIPDFYARHPLPALLDEYRAAGFGELRVRRLSFGGGVVIWGTRTG